MSNEASKGSVAEQPSDKNYSGMTGFAYLNVLIVGIYLGILFVKSEVASWQRIHKMFLFEEPTMYLVIGLAILVAMVSMLLIKHFHVKSVDGKPITYQAKPFHAGVIIGGMMFGAGWAVAGACPGPIYAQVFAGEWPALATLAGALLGMFAYAACKSKLPH